VNVFNTGVFLLADAEKHVKKYRLALVSLEKVELDLLVRKNEYNNTVFLKFGIYLRKECHDTKIEHLPDRQQVAE